MLEAQKAYLDNLQDKYLNIGITENGEPRNMISVPWKHDSNAYNMRTPELWLSAEDVKDPCLLARLKGLCIRGCYIFTPLEDYSFLAELKGLWDLHIRQGGALRGLSFMREMREWFMLYIEDARLDDLSPAFPENWREKGLHSYCVAFVNCRVKDISALEREDIRLSELLVCQPEGTNEKKKWSRVRAGTYRYWEYRE